LHEIVLSLGAIAPIVGTGMRCRAFADRSPIMSKARQGNKEQKKPPTLTPKEKKAVKQTKKHAQDVVPFIVR
jgi:hypothetical protein